MTSSTTAQQRAAGAVSLEVIDVLRPTPDAVHIVARQPVPALVNVAGQYLTVLVDVDGKVLARSYSLTTTPDLDDTVAVVVKRTPGGRVSNHLNDTVRPGHRLTVLPPQGFFVLTPAPPAGRRVVLLAAGSGITPVYAMARAVLDSEPRSDVRLVYANLDEASIIFRDELDGLVRNHPERLVVTHVLEDPGSLPHALPGLLTPPLARRLLREPAGGLREVEYYVCGPDGFMGTACAALQDLAVPGRRVRVERFTPSEAPPTEAGGQRTHEMVLSGAGSSTRLTMAGDQTLLDRIEEAGVFLPYSCRVGDCGTCKVRLLHGTVTTTNLDGLSQDDEADGYVLTCVSRPTPTSSSTYRDPDADDHPGANRVVRAAPNRQEQHMTVPLIRDRARTRKALLDTAGRVMVQHGPSVSLDMVAREAGVSKGGLLHHFPTKDALLVGLVEEWLAHFEAGVRGHLDDTDERPGRRARAHIRAAFDDKLSMQEGLWRHTSVMTALIGVPEVLARAQQAGRRWHEELLQDGLHPQRVTLILRTLDGTTMAELFEGRLDAAERTATETLLLALTEEAGPLISP